MDKDKIEENVLLAYVNADRDVIVLETPDEAEARKFQYIMFCDAEGRHLSTGEFIDMTKEWSEIKSCICEKLRICLKADDELSTDSVRFVSGFRVKGFPSNNK